MTLFTAVFLIPPFFSRVGIGGVDCISNQFGYFKNTCIQTEDRMINGSKTFGPSYINGRSILYKVFDPTVGLIDLARGGAKE